MTSGFYLVLFTERFPLLRLKKDVYPIKISTHQRLRADVSLPPDIDESY